MAAVGNFVQNSPEHENSFKSDVFLQRSLNRIAAESGKSNYYDQIVRPDLERFGQRVVDEIWDLGRKCEMDPPKIDPAGTDPWGRRLPNPLRTCESWKLQKAISAEEGLISIAYPDQDRSEMSRIHQVAKLFLYGPSSGLFSCPLAMTDGAAYILSSRQKDGILGDAFRRLISRDPKMFWTSGQWMTEKRGGSDVGGGTQTYAIKDGEGYRLHGYKWFSSATDSDMALTLARIVEDDRVVSGTQGISMFFLKTHDDHGGLNSIELVKLKNKLGTRQLPTAELLLDGSRASLVSDPGLGIKSISPMLTVTRMHNMIASVSAQRKILSLARDYACRRLAFGRLLKDHPLHLHTLMEMETEVRGCTALMVDLAHKMGLEENNVATDRDRALLRLMMPVAKAYTAKKAVSGASEGLECFGGQGYIEDTGLPTIFRDAQVLPIWEGTTNVMALDVVRAILKTKGEVVLYFFAQLERIIKDGLQSNDSNLKKAVDNLNTAFREFKGQNFQLDKMMMDPKLSGKQVMLRDFLMTLSNLYISGLLIEHACFYKDCKSDAAIALNWTTGRDLIPIVTRMRKTYLDDPDILHEIVYEGYEPDSNVKTRY